MSAPACCPTCGQALPELTPLQQAIAGALDEGHARQEIADALGCSLSAVDQVARRLQGPARRGRRKRTP